MAEEPEYGYKPGVQHRLLQTSRWGRAGGGAGRETENRWGRAGDREQVFLLLRNTIMLTGTEWHDWNE